MERINPHGLRFTLVRLAEDRARIVTGTKKIEVAHSIGRLELSVV